MSCANILGSAPNRGTVCSDDLLTAYGFLTVGAGATTSNTVSIPFLKTTDVVILSTLGTAGFAGGSTPAQLPPALTQALYAGVLNIQNPGLSTATLALQNLTASSAGVTTYFSYMVFSGETS
jgi:hypothetical protein